MIWILLTAYFLGGGLAGVSGSLLTSEMLELLHARSQTVITDPERSEAASGNIRELQKDVRAFERKVSKASRQMMRSYREHDADEAKARTILDELNTAWLETQLEALERRFILKEQLTESEWQTLFNEEEAGK